MSDYNPSDLTNTLIYVKNRFGTNVFTKPGRVPALVSDLAPNLKNEKAMLERMSRLGILKDFAQTSNMDDDTKKRLIAKSMIVLTQSEYIRPAIAATYLSTLVAVFGWNIEVEIPKESSMEKMKFDSQRYFQEAQDCDFLSGKRAYEAEKFDEARLLFSKAYKRGNVLAGINLGEIYYSGNGCEPNYDKAISLFVDGMQRGCPLGAEWLAEAYRTGKGVPRDQEKAKKIFDFCVDALEAMCASGSQDAQYVYGFDLLYGSFSDCDDKKAFYWLEKAMKAGVVAAGVQIAKIYLNGWGCERNEKRGVEILDKYATSKNRNVHFELGKVFYYGKIKEQDYIKARKHFWIAAKEGHASSQNYVGDMYYWGKGVEKNYSEARKWYELAEKRGNKLASLSLGYIYYYGEGVVKDIDKAFKYFKYAADNGVANAQYMLHCFYFSDGNYTDYEMGKVYLEKSAEQGNVLAQKLLAICYIGAFNFINDDTKFVYWIRKASEQGDAEAQRILGEAYISLDNNEALPKSYPDAITWLNKAADQGDIQALILLAEIYSAGEGVDKDLYKTKDYLQQAECRLAESEESGNTLIVEHNKIACLYYKLYSDKANRQIAFDHYCKAFSAGDRSAAYDLGWMYFINGYESAYLNMSDGALLNTIKKEENESESSNLAYLLGQIYYNGYRVTASKSEAEKWYQRAIKKGSLAACCKLASYYINYIHGQQIYNIGFTLLDGAYKRGSVEGTRLLGLCYKDGIGVKKDLSKAKALLKEASQKGDIAATEELKKFLL